MSDEITPALTPDQWHDALKDRAGYASAMQLAWGNDTSRENDHALAALCLFPQPFGFTHAELEALAILCEEIDRPMVFLNNGEEGELYITSAIAKVRALLPPPVIAHPDKSS
jgi:hypothetical protein